MSFKEITHPDHRVILENPTVYVDNEKRGRSGHMSHAMAQFAPGCFIDFNSNCSANRHGGHFPYGWVEYRISRDCGKTYSDVKTLDYSMDCFLDGVHYISVEKAVACDDGTIVAICLRNDATHTYCCEPWSTPTVILSHDEGETWSDPYEMCPHAGRPYDACYHNGAIYVLHYCNEHFLGTDPSHVYRIYKSEDCGKSFRELSVIPFDTLRRGYGSILFDDKGDLHAYAYNEGDECNMDHAVSHDGGKSWEVLAPCFLEKGIRNPQTALVDGVYILNGRAKEVLGFVLYTSKDGNVWDEGIFVEYAPGAGAYYSNNLNLCDENGNFLLIQYSSCYDGKAKVNVMHMNLRVQKDL